MSIVNPVAADGRLHRDPHAGREANSLRVPRSGSGRELLLTLEALVDRLALGSADSWATRLSCASRALAADVYEERDWRSSDGRLILTAEGQARIKLRAGLSGARHAAVLGHELGHLLLARHEMYEVDAGPLDVGGHVEERFCDALSALLVMGSQLLPKSDTSLRSIVDGARATDLPVSIVAQRWAYAVDKDVLVVLLRRGPGGWTTTRTVGTRHVALTAPSSPYAAVAGVVDRLPLGRLVTVSLCESAEGSAPRACQVRRVGATLAIAGPAN